MKSQPATSQLSSLTGTWAWEVMKATIGAKHPTASAATPAPLSHVAVSLIRSFRAVWFTGFPSEKFGAHQSVTRSGRRRAAYLDLILDLGERFLRTLDPGDQPGIGMIHSVTE